MSGSPLAPSQRRPRWRITLRQLLITVAALAFVNGLGVSMERPLGTPPDRPVLEADPYFDASEEVVQHRYRVQRQRVFFLQLVTILVGNTFVLTALGYSVIANYLEAYRKSESQP